MNEILVTRAVLVAVAVTVLGGCVTAEGMREEKPMFEATSTKPLDEIAACLNSRWVSTSSLPITSVPTGNGYTYSSQGTVRDVTVDLVDEGTERRLTAYYRRFLGITAINEDAHRAQMESCL